MVPARVADSSGTVDARPSVGRAEAGCAVLTRPRRRGCLGERDIVAKYAGAEADRPRRPFPTSIGQTLERPGGGEERLSAAGAPVMLRSLAAA